MKPLFVYGGLFFLALCPIGTWADNHLMTEKANQLYHNRSYAEAAQLYQQLIDDGYHHADLYYNAGNAYYRKGELGRAIQYYRQSLDLTWNDNTYQNLQLVQQDVKDPAYVKSIIKDMQSPYATLTHWSLNTWAILSGLSFFGLMAWVILRYLNIIKGRWSIALPLFIYLFTTGSMIYLYYKRFVNYPLVVVKPNIQFKSEQSQGRRQLFDGTEVRALNNVPNGLQVELPDGEKGIIQRGDAIAW
ncbi:MAG: tetratricopeptide repeat protein [Chitinophagaceae bacterium]|nr:tetratricopeptide repeat protein [Chitinophagaceae bacterium]